jgi:hypothetical protein
MNDRLLPDYLDRFIEVAPHLPSRAAKLVGRGTLALEPMALPRSLSRGNSALPGANEKGPR